MAKHRLIYDGQEYAVDVSKSSSGYTIIVGDDTFSAEVNGVEALLTWSGETTRGAFAATRERIFIESDSELFEFAVVSVDNYGEDHSQAGDKDKLFAPMPGKIVKILIAIGDQVKAKQPLAIIESMKMENQLLAPGPGTVKAINFKPGDQVDTDSVIIELEIEE